MPKRFEFSADFDHPVDRVHALLTDEGYWRSRMPPQSRGSVRVDRTSDGDGQSLVTVTMTEAVDTDTFPALVRKVIRGEMRMERIDTWRAVHDGRASGTLAGSATGIPVTIDGEYTLRPGTSGSVLDVRGTATVRIPLVGSQIELLVRQMVSQVVERDRAEAHRRLDNG
ncbi:DUF2505 domain-containing protein [Rhodococcus sp. TAF43]|uniref:DUF2505 domain-containing protein n=1 Tax=unclassified Rhodococcus (in: high G+C Gram-positive bacteria) TaxID=192944 RepID=UPI0015814483|nr:DUF2505 domain-containing protein [Rhodococcus sp. W8901]QKT10545.1 DUF2505 domain-containing protein [Rhodococcus sp. W8901]